MVIKDTTKEAFEDFLGFNYEKKIDFESKTLEELYEVFNLAERYQVEELKEVVSTSIKHFPLSIDNLVKSAAIAKEYGHFENVSDALYASCVDFAKAQFTDGDSVLTFVQENNDDTMVMKILKDIKLPAMKKICSNCRQQPCRNKSGILASDLLTPGMNVKTRDDCYWAWECRQKLCSVVSVSPLGRVSVSRTELPTSPYLSYPQRSQIVKNGRCLIEYACDK